MKTGRRRVKDSNGDVRMAGERIGGVHRLLFPCNELVVLSPTISLSVMAHSRMEKDKHENCHKPQDSCCLIFSIKFQRPYMYEAMVSGYKVRNRFFVKEDQLYKEGLHVFFISFLR